MAMAPDLLAQSRTLLPLDMKEPVLHNHLSQPSQQR